MSDRMVGIHHNLDNETYRAEPALSATFLKGCIRSVKHALTPRKETKALRTGLHAHEFLLEHDKFSKSYAPSIDLNDHADAIGTVDELKAAIETLNESRKLKLKTTGSRDELIESLMQDDPHHFDGVQDINTLSVADLKKRIQFVNQSPDRGLLSTSGSALAMADRLRDNGYIGEIVQHLIADHAAQNSDRTIIPIDEWRTYEAMRESLLTHLEIGAESGDSLFAWLLAAFRGHIDLETEVSVFAYDIAGNRIKCRLDGRFMAGDKRVGIELKTTQDATQEAFERKACRLHYDMQNEHYSDVCAAAGEPLDMMVIIAIEPEAPHGVSVLVPDEEYRLTGRKKLSYAKRRYAEYCASPRSSVYSASVKSISSPLWNTCGPWENEEL